MEELNELLKALEAWYNDPALMAGTDYDLREALRAYRNAPTPLVLESVDAPEQFKTIADLDISGTFCYVMFNGECYKLPETE